MLHIKILGSSKMIWFYQIWEAINKSRIEINHHPANAGCWTLREGENRETVQGGKKKENSSLLSIRQGCCSKTTSSLCWNQPSWCQVCSALLSALCGSRLALTPALLFFFSFLFQGHTHWSSSVSTSGKMWFTFSRQPVALEEVSSASEKLIKIHSLLFSLHKTLRNGLGQSYEIDKVCLSHGCP